MQISTTRGARITRGVWGGYALEIESSETPGVWWVKARYRLFIAALSALSTI